MNGVFFWKVTPITGRAESPRVSTQTQNLSPINVSYDNFWNMEAANQAIALVTNHWTNLHWANAVIHSVTGKEMEYMALVKDPDLHTLWKRGFGNEVGRLFHAIHDIQGTNTCFFIEHKSYMAKLSVTASLTKKRRTCQTNSGR
jgi:hypothetical protein